MLVWDASNLKAAIKLSQHPELGRLKTLSLFMDFPSSAETKDFPELRRLFFQIKTQNSAVSIVITDTASSSWFPAAVRKQNWMIKDYPKSRSYFPLSDVLEELHHVGFCPWSFTVLGESQRQGGYTFGTTAAEVSAWKQVLSKVESVSLHFKLVASSGRDYNVLAELPCLQSLQLTGGSSKDLAIPTQPSYSPLCFPQLKHMRLKQWFTSMEELITFLRQQPKLEDVSLEGVRWASGMGNYLASTAMKGEGLQELFRRVTGVKKATAGLEMDKWVAAIIKARLG